MVAKVKYAARVLLSSC